MKKTILLHNHGWSYVETVMSIAILSIIIISVSMVISLSGKIGVTYKKKVQAHQFAQSIIEDLRRRSGENFIGVRNSTITYNAFMNGGSGSSDMIAYLEITMKEGTKKVDINISWTDADGLNNTTYSTQISPRGSFDGGIAKGKVLYIAYLDANHRIPTDLGPGETGGPDEIYSEAKKEYYAGAGGVTVKALSNDDDGAYVITKTDDNGEFLLNNVKVDPLTNTTIYFYKEGSYPTAYSSQFEQAYYFFDKGPDLPSGAENPYNQRGLYTKQVSFPKSGHEEDIGEIICAKAWDFYVQAKIDGEPFSEFHVWKYRYFNIIRVKGDVLRWGIHDSFENNSFATDRNYWDITDHLVGNAVWPHPSSWSVYNWEGFFTFPGRGTPEVEYNCHLHNLRPVPVQSGGVSPLSITFEFERVRGTYPNVPKSDNLFIYGTLKSSHTISFNPVNINPFGPGSGSSGFSHLIAPLSAELSGSDFPMKEHTQEEEHPQYPQYFPKGFRNTLNLVVEDNNEYGDLINPLIVKLTSVGSLTGTVRDTVGNPLSGFLVGYYTDGHDGVTKKKYYISTDAQGNYELNNVIDELDGVSFSKTSVEHDSLYAYGEVGGIKYYGLPVTVNTLGYDDIDALALVGQENAVDFVVYPGVNVQGKVETVNPYNPPIEFEVYMREVLGWNTTISVNTQDVGGDAEYSFAGNSIKRSVHDQNLPIGVRSVDPAVGVPVIFDITVKDKDTSASVVGATVTVTQHLFDGASWDVEWNGANDFYRFTGSNGQLNDTMSLPLTHERWTVIPKTGGPFQVDLTQAEGHAVDDGHAMFSWVRVTHADYEPINVWFGSSDSIPPGATFTRTIQVAKKTTRTISFTLTFSHKDDLNDPPALIPVDTIVIRYADHYSYPYGDGDYVVTAGPSYTFTDIGLLDLAYIEIIKAINNTIGGMKYNSKVYLTEKHNNKTIHIKIGYESGS